MCARRKRPKCCRIHRTSDDDPAQSPSSPSPRSVANTGALGDEGYNEGGVRVGEGANEDGVGDEGGASGVDGRASLKLLPWELDG